MAPESVLQHSGFVVLACYCMCLELNSVATARSEEIPLGEVLARAIVHDLDEIAVGDIARPTKYHSAETLAMFDRLKVIGINKIIKDLLLAQSAAASLLLHHAEAKHGREGFIVDVADKAAVIYKLWDECLLRHNFTMLKQAVHLQSRGFLADMRDRIADHAFNKQQAFYLHGLIGNMNAIMEAVVAKQHKIHGIVDEALGG